MKFLNEFASKTRLKEYGLATDDFALAKSGGEAVDYANKIGYPVVMKIVSDQIIHKTEAKGVKLNIQSPGEAQATYDELLANAKAYDASAVIEGILVTPMLSSGVEVIVGGLRDVQFGPVIMFGLGGVFVEIFKDVEFRMAPLTEKEAMQLIKSIKAFPMLAGARGKQPVRLDLLADLIVKLSTYLNEHPEVKEIDLNPVLCVDEKVLALDAVIGLDE